MKFGGLGFRAEFFRGVYEVLGVETSGFEGLGVYGLGFRAILASLRCQGFGGWVLGRWFKARGV